MNIAARGRRIGDPSFISWFTADAYNQFAEMRWGTYEECHKRITESTESVERVELLAIHDGKPAGICVLVQEVDAHVGPCIGVMWQYVLPWAEQAGISRAFLRYAERLARNLNIPAIAWTHRTGLGVYSVRYRRLHGQSL